MFICYGPIQLDRVQLVTARYPFILSANMLNMPDRATYTIAGHKQEKTTHSIKAITPGKEGTTHDVALRESNSALNRWRVSTVLLSRAVIRGPQTPRKPSRSVVEAKAELTFPKSALAFAVIVSDSME